MENNYSVQPGDWVIKETLGCWLNCLFKHELSCVSSIMCCRKMRRLCPHQDPHRAAADVLTPAFLLTACSVFVSCSDSQFWRTWWGWLVLSVSPDSQVQLFSICLTPPSVHRPSKTCFTFLLPPSSSCILPRTSLWPPTADDKKLAVFSFYHFSLISFLLLSLNRCNIFVMNNLSP